MCECNHIQSGEYGARADSGRWSLTVAAGQLTQRPSPSVGSVPALHSNAAEDNETIDAHVPVSHGVPGCNGCQGLHFIATGGQEGGMGGYVPCPAAGPVHNRKVAQDLLHLF